MGFDIIGKAPRSKAGKCFSVNCSRWSELKDLAIRKAAGLEIDARPDPALRVHPVDVAAAPNGLGLHQAGGTLHADVFRYGLRGPAEVDRRHDHERQAELCVVSI
jgi:hypothetical protein